MGRKYQPKEYTVTVIRAEHTPEEEVRIRAQITQALTEMKLKVMERRGEKTGT